jgi:hypothetical protein
MRRLAADRRLSSCRGVGNQRAPGTTCPRPPGFGNRRVQSSRERRECWCRAVPAQLLHNVEEIDIGAKRGERPEEQSEIPLAGESVGEGTRVGSVHVPVAPVRGDGFEMGKL